MAHIPIRFTFVCLLVLLSGSCLQAQWAEEGIPLSQGNTTSADQALIPDGDGGVLFIQVQNATALTASRLDRHGREIWAAEIPTYPGLSTANALCVVPDLENGAWMSYYGTVLGVGISAFVTHIDVDGNLLLGDGVKVSGATTATLPHGVLCPDGGYALAWTTSRSSTGDIYVQKVAADGTLLWGADGTAICTEDLEQSDPLVVSDGLNGLIAVWEDNRNGNTDFYAQRVDADGAAMWTADGVAVCSETSSQSWLAVCSDDAGGAIAAWMDDRDGYDIRAQRIGSDGTMLWTTDGIVAITGSGIVSSTACAPDGSGGVVVACLGTTSAGLGPHANRLDAEGDDCWYSGQKLLAPVTSVARLVQVTVTPDAVAHYAWEMNTGDSWDIYRQKTSATGVLQCGTYGTDVCAGAGDQLNAALCLDEDDALFVCWEDDREGYQDAWGQRIDAIDVWGYPGAMLHGAADVPADQGGFVNLSWYASSLDTWGDVDVSGYTLWRSLVGAKSASTATVLDDPAQWSPDLAGPVVLAGASDGFWELIDSVEPYGLSGYGRIVSTPYDSVAVDTPPISYMVITHTTSAAWMSEPLSCLSVDDIAPAAPTGLAGDAVYTPAGLDLSWDANDESDLSHYLLYRGGAPDFTPDASTLVSAVEDTLYFFAGASASDVYRLSAVDIHGNEGPSALLTLGSITGVETTPLAFELGRNVPNPFNPSTRIPFALERAERADLAVYDVSGRRVRILVAGTLSAGDHAVVWDGRDGAGRQAASGAYYAVLRSGGETRTRKMTLVK